jgi:methyl-accepting chemotaxis protein
MASFLDKLQKYNMSKMLTTGFLATLIPVIIVGYVTYTGMNTIKQETTNLNRQAALAEQINYYRILVNRYHGKVLELLFLKKAEKANEIKATEQEILKTSSELKKDGISESLIAKLDSDSIEYFNAVNPMLTGFNNKKLVDAQEAKAGPLYSKYLEAVIPISKEIDSSKDKSLAELASTQALVQKNALIAVCFSILLTLVIILLSRTVIIVPLRMSFNKVMDTAKQVAKFSQDLSDNSNQMSMATNQISTAISQVATGASNQSQNANDAARLFGEISESVGQVSSSAKNQANSISSMVTEVNKLIGSISEVTNSADIVSGVVDSASDVAQKGQGAVEETVSGMSRIRETVLNSADKIQELGSKSEQIGEIIGVIDDIAEQTNLLALNAAIEAARAGEHGKGFAVVADEVRKLAERSARATGEITDLIKGIQYETQEAVDAMESGTAEVESGSKLAVNAGSAIEEILSSVKEIVSQISQVSDNAKNMTVASERVSRLIDQIAAISEETSAVAGNVASSAGQAVEAVDVIAATSEESAAAAEQVSASAQEQSATVSEISARVQNLSAMADDLEKLVGAINL